MTMVLSSVIFLGGLGVLFSLMLVAAQRKFAVDTDPRVAQIEEALPGTNCGACGYPSCALYAEAVAGGDDLEKCVVGGQDTLRALASIMGVEVSDAQREPKVAVVFCQGGSDVSWFPGVYRGIEDCAAAEAGQDVAKRCQYGCIGLASCVRACKFDAIHMAPNGIPYVDASKCTACGACVRACPRDLIELHPVSHEHFVYCKSQDPGPIAKKVCEVACTACKICVKAAQKDDNPSAVTMQGNLAVVTPEPYTAKGEYGDRCPTDAYATDRNMVNRDRVLSTIRELQGTGVGS